jgi:hypothetical protein
MPLGARFSTTKTLAKSDGDGHSNCLTFYLDQFATIVTSCPRILSASSVRNSTARRAFLRFTLAASARRTSSGTPKR